MYNRMSEKLAQKVLKFIVNWDKPNKIVLIKNIGDGEALVKMNDGTILLVEMNTGKYKIWTQ